MWEEKCGSITIFRVEWHVLECLYIEMMEGENVGRGGGWRLG